MAATLRRSSKGFPGETRSLFLEFEFPSPTTAPPLMGRDESRIYPNAPVRGRGSLDGAFRPPIFHFPSFHPSIADHHYQPKDPDCNDHYGPPTTDDDPYSRTPVEFYHCGSRCASIDHHRHAIFPTYWSAPPSPSPGPPPGLDPRITTSSNIDSEVAVQNRAASNSSYFHDENMSTSRTELTSKKGDEVSHSQRPSVKSKFSESFEPSDSSVDATFAEVMTSLSRAISNHLVGQGMVASSVNRVRGNTDLSLASATSFADSDLLETSSLTRVHSQVAPSQKSAHSYGSREHQTSPQDSAPSLPLRPPPPPPPASKISSKFSLFSWKGWGRSGSLDSEQALLSAGEHVGANDDAGVVVINSDVVDDDDDGGGVRDPRAPRVSVHYLADHCANCPTVLLNTHGQRVSDGTRLVEVGTYVVEPGHVCTCEKDAAAKQNSPQRRRSSLERLQLKELFFHAVRRVSLSIHHSKSRHGSDVDLSNLTRQCSQDSGYRSGRSSLRRRRSSGKSKLKKFSVSVPFVKRQDKRAGVEGVEEAQVDGLGRLLRMDGWTAFSGL